jgi:hypothetical protein
MVKTAALAVPPGEWWHAGGGAPAAGGVDKRKLRRTLVLLFLGCLVIYHVNGRPHAGVDTFAAPYTAWSLLRHGSLDLSGYPELEYLRGSHVLPARDGSWISLRPLGSALATVPVIAPLALVMERPPNSTNMHHLGKLASALMVAGAVVLFFLLCRRLAPVAAWPATVLFGLGTTLCSVAAQAIWMHGPATFWLCLALYLLVPPPGTAITLRRSGWAGLALGMAVLTRPTTAFFALATGLTFLAQRRWRSLLGLALGSVFPLTLYLLPGFIYFGDPLLGGYAQDNWSGGTPWWLGSAGLLIAPSRGLLVYSPALLLLPLGLWTLWRPPTPATASTPRALLLAWFAAAAATLVFYGRWYDWRGGWCFGPRFLCETMPVCCLLFAFAFAALQSLWQRRLALALVALSVLVQLIGIHGHKAESAWCARHDLSDQGRSLFSLHDTQIETYAWAALDQLGRRLSAVLSLVSPR